MNELKHTHSIRIAEEKLFTEWRNKLSLQNKIFIPDGVVNQQAWEISHDKILFLLKEVNGGDIEWDERDYLANYNTKLCYKKTHSLTISSVIQWTHAISSNTADNWSDIIKLLSNVDFQSSILQQIALVNVKKTPGVGIVESEKFNDYWNIADNIQYLKKQLEIYIYSEHYPNFIICGSTAWYYNELFKEEHLQWKSTKRGIAYCKHNNTIVIDYCHPQARIASNIKYYALFDAIAEIKSLKHNGIKE